MNSSSEVLTAENPSECHASLQARPFSVYAATETGGIAAECDQHHDMHLFEDLVIPEVVDNDYRQSPMGYLEIDCSSPCSSTAHCRSSAMS